MEIPLSFVLGHGSDLYRKYKAKKGGDTRGFWQDYEKGGKDQMNWKKYMECKTEEERKKMIDEHNKRKKIMEDVWIILISLLTSLITVYLAAGPMGL